MAGVDDGSEQAAMAAYLEEGARRAAALGNRGPVRFGPDGRIHRDILDAYWRCGFYVLEGVLGAEELAEIDADIRDLLDRLPVRSGATHDARGRRAIGDGPTAKGREER